MLTAESLSHSVFEEKLDGWSDICVRLQRTQYSIEVLSGGRRPFLFKSVDEKPISYSEGGAYIPAYGAILALSRIHRTQSALVQRKGEAYNRPPLTHKSLTDPARGIPIISNVLAYIYLHSSIRQPNRLIRSTK